MSKFFSFKYEDLEISMPKSDVKFNYGYGVFEASYVNIDSGMLYALDLIGIVDEEFNVINLAPKYIMPKIVVFPNDIFIFQYNSTESLDNPQISLYREKYPDIDETECDNLGPCDFKVVSDEVIMLDGIGNGNRLCALYNVVTREALTPYFNYIGEFKENTNYGKKVAEAVALIKDDNGNIIDELSCIIDLDGNVLSGYKTRVSGLEFDGDKPLADVLEEVNKAIRGR